MVDMKTSEQALAQEQAGRKAWGKALEQEQEMGSKRSWRQALEQKREQEGKMALEQEQAGMKA